MKYCETGSQQGVLRTSFTMVRTHSIGPLYERPVTWAAWYLVITISAYADKTSVLEKHLCVQVMKS